MSGTIELVEKLGEGIVALRYSHFGVEPDVAIWTLGKLRKSAVCPVTGLSLAPGDQAWRPVGNQQYRMERLSTLAVAGVSGGGGDEPA